MKKIYSIAVIVQLIVISHTAVLAQDSSATWKEVKGTNYTISFPDTWEVSVLGDVGVSLAGQAPLDNKKDPFRENCTMVVEPVDVGIDLKTYAEEASTDALKNADNAIVSVSQLNPTKNGPNYEIIYTAEQGGLTIRYVQYYYISGGFAYILTLAGEFKNKAVYEAQFDQIASGLKFN